MSKIPYRQIHLDFHTSPFIEGIGEKYNSEEFIATLKAAKVNSINVFAKCHHGMFYYPTDIGTMHPHLKFDLFGEQIKALKENDIRALAYTCVVWNEEWAERHPEWLTVNYDGTAGGKKPFECEHTSWKNLCINNPDYGALLKTELKEIYDRYKPDGFWIDIVLGKDCVCAHCQKDMLTLGLDPKNFEHVNRFNTLVEIKFCKEFYLYIKQLNQELEVYFNSRPYALDDGEDEQVASATKRRYFDFLDIESLPSEQWGYTHFPVAANYVNKYDMELCMMNGKFHTAWGDFGSLRHRNALEYECLRGVAHGAKICVGDQLHPNGRLEKAAYERIGEVFSKVEALEQYVDDAKKVAEVCVFIPTSTSETDPLCGGIVEEGVYRVLSEMHVPFDFVNAVDSFDKYRLMILPDMVKLSERVAKRIDEFVNSGGKLLVTGRSAVLNESFMLDCIPAHYNGVSEFDTEYIRLSHECFDGVPNMDHVVYNPGVNVGIKQGAEVLAHKVEPYFARTYDRFCSHRHTPPMSGHVCSPAILKNDSCIYVSSPLFTNYSNYAYTSHRDILHRCIALLYTNPVIKTDLPALSEITLYENKTGFVAHMLNYVIQRKANRLDTIEEVYTVLDKTLSIRTDFVPSNVVKIPQQTPVEHNISNGHVNITIDCEQGYSGYLVER